MASTMRGIEYNSVYNVIHVRNLSEREKGCPHKNADTPTKRNALCVCNPVFLKPCDRFLVAIVVLPSVIRIITHTLRTRVRKLHSGQ